MHINIELKDLEQTKAFAKFLAHNLVPGQIIYLGGDLGVGKTTLVRAYLQELGYKGKAKSPTYTFVESYKIDQQIIYHFDLYRLAEPEELEFLGGRDYWQGSAICFIEWPEKGGGYLPTSDLAITLQHAGIGRNVEIEAHSESGLEIIQRLTTWQK